MIGIFKLTFSNCSGIGTSVSQNIELSGGRGTKGKCNSRKKGRKKESFLSFNGKPIIL
jgi:hypothetical protein